MTLEVLVDEQYLRSIPIDPITKSRESWLVTYEELDPDALPAETELDETGQPGIVDVRSGAEGLSLDGTPYSEF